METYTINVNTILETTECSECGITFAIPKDRLDRERSKKGNGWYCPNGHGQVFKDTEVMRLKHRLDQTEAANEQLRNERDAACRSASTYKGHLTRTKKRIRAGVCTECHRHFDNLQDHMEHEHGTPEEREKVVKSHRS